MININIESWMNYGNGQKVSIRPKPERLEGLEPIEVKVDLTNDGDGHLDYVKIISCLEKAIFEHLRVQLNLLPKARYDTEFMNQLKQAIIENGFMVNSNILEMFDFYPEYLEGKMEPCLIPVKMKIFGRVVIIWGCAAEGGGYDLEGLRDYLEDACREVLSVPARHRVFSDSQRNAIRANGTKWIEKLKEEYRDHIADKLGYSKEPEYRYKEIKTYSFPTFSGVIMQGKGIHGSFTLSGSIIIKNNKLHMDIMGKTAILGQPTEIVWDGTITLLKNGVSVSRKGLPWTSKGIWPGKNSGKVPAGAVDFQLDPPNPNDKWQLKFDVGYVCHESTGSE